VNDIWLELLAQASTASDDASKKERLVDWLTSNPVIGWSITVLAVFSMTATAVAKLTGNLDKICQFIDKYRPKKRETVEQERERLREELIKVILGQVIQRLENSLHHKIRLDLKRQEERQRVGKPDLVTTEKSYSSESLIPRIFNSFISSQSEPRESHTSTAVLLERDDIKGRLLILGEPGGGKTNELLTVAKELLQKRQQSNDGPIPVIFELSEWLSDQGQSFENWLTEKLQEKYNVPPKVAKHWIKHNQLLPLLDGLDELQRVDDAANGTLDQKCQARQTECIRAINEFLDLYPSTSMVVCCRRREYKALEVQGEYLKRLNGAIYLQQLDDNQIADYLNACNKGSLWDILQNQPQLLKLVRSPLFLLMLVVAYQGESIESTDQLLDLYIEKQLNDLNNQGAYPPGKAPSKEQTHHYLSWLAHQLEKQQVTEFLIEQLQPTWLEQRQEKRLYTLSVGLIFWLIAGLIGVLIGIPISEYIGGLIGALMFWLLFGLLCKVYSIGGLYEINPTEKLDFSLKIPLTKNLIGGLIAALITGLLLGLSESPIVGLISILIALPCLWLYEGIKTFESEINDKQQPNQGIGRSIKTSLSVMLITGLIVGLIEGLSQGSSLGLIWVAIVGSFGLGIGLSEVIKHLTLRFVIYCCGIGPCNYENFLEHAENHRFIQRVGGRYRFIHDLLRKRFAEQY